MKKIILISAKARHGKDSLADYLKVKLEEKGERVAITHFAKYLKGILKDYYQWDGVSKDIYWRDKLQTLGTEKIKEELNMKCFHAMRIAQDIQIVQDDFDIVLIPDCRCRSEVYYMQSMFPDNTIAVRVSRIGFESDLTQEQKEHSSETDLDLHNFDYNINVESGLQNLYDECDIVLGEVLGYTNKEGEVVNG